MVALCGHVVQITSSTFNADCKGPWQREWLLLPVWYFRNVKIVYQRVIKCVRWA